MREEPVLAYRVLGHKRVPGRLRGLGGVSAPLEGRRREREALVAAAARLKKGSGGIDWLEGAAGLGKSCLVDEIKQIWLTSEQISQPPSGWSSLETVSYPYETGQPYSLVQRLFRPLAGSTGNDSPTELQRKPERWYSELSPSLFKQAALVLPALFSTTAESLSWLIIRSTQNQPQFDRA